MMKKIKFTMVALAMMLFACSIFSIKANAASYPLLIPEQYSMECKKGEVAELVYSYFPEFKNEKIEIKIYNEDGVEVSNAAKTFYHLNSNMITYTVTWDTSNYELGTYTVEATVSFYTLYSWHYRPTTIKRLVTIKGDSGWKQDGIGWWYLNENGTYPSNGWAPIGDKWYYFDENGYMKTGWVYDGAWYYLNSSGEMATGWVSDGGIWYFMDGSGAMKTGWVYDGAWYYMNSDGAMQTGWIYDGAWYCLHSSGVMATGWVLDGSTWYWLESSGVWSGYSESV